MFTKSTGTRAIRGHLQHGNRTIVIVEQGFIGYAMDNGQPVLLPPGLHVWTSESLMFESAVNNATSVPAHSPMLFLSLSLGRPR